MEKEQFELIATNIGALTARTCVNEFVLASLLASHPNPTGALEFWNRHLAEASDRGFESSGLPAFPAVLQEQLAHWSKALAAAVARES
ncbi:hypothetical protein [Stenotrophomonas sp. TWI587]|uniref:hypothetical protein n=1 Tax=Stenotrophomonas sp. TWI587 TaxID=3136783 RepID=UPI003209B54E